MLSAALAVVMLWGLVLCAPFKPVWRRWLVTASACIPAGLCSWFGVQLAWRRELYEEHSWLSALDVVFALQLDGLSGIFALLITGVGAAVMLYSAWYEIPKRSERGFDALLFWFMGAMLGVVLADDVVTLFVFWELTGVISYLLVGFRSEEAMARRAARQALLVTSFGGAAMLVGLLLLGRVAGTFRISEQVLTDASVGAHPSYPLIVMLVVTGAFAKSAIFPFHFWLPGAMTAPTPVSAYLHSATMVKAGVYLLTRLTPVLGDSTLWSVLLAAGGGATLLAGAVRLVKEQDLKRILAETTVMGLGGLTLLIGLPGSHASTAFAVFLVVHALYKASLFMTAGAIEHATHTRHLPHMGGLWRALPKTCVCATIGSVAMAGMPPTLAFIGKELMYKATLNASAFAGALTAVAVIGNAAMVCGALLVTVRIFWGPKKPLSGDIHEASWALLLAPFVLAVASLMFGVFHGVIERGIVEPSVNAVEGDGGSKLHLWGGFSPMLVLSGVTLSLGYAFYRFRPRLQALSAALPRALQPRVQGIYTGALYGLRRSAELSTRVVQSGRLTIYLTVVFSVAVLAMAWPLPDFVRAGASVELRPLDWLAAALIVLGVVRGASAGKRVEALLGAAVFGVGVGLLFLFIGALDVALAQFAAEAVLLAVLVLSTASVESPPVKRRRKVADATRALFAVAAGVVTTSAVLWITSGRFDTRLSDHFVAEVSAPGHVGSNVVNAILVEFRAFDTLGELAALTAATLAVWAAVSRAPRGPLRAGQARSEQLHIFEVISAVALPVLIVASLWLLLRGHHYPGGGFVGGLLAAGAMVLYGLGHGTERVAAGVPFAPHYVAVAGLSLAVIAGCLPLFVDEPFLKSLWWTEYLGTSVLFELGVYLVVVGGFLTVASPHWEGTRPWE